MRPHSLSIILKIFSKYTKKLNTCQIFQGYLSFQDFVTNCDGQNFWKEDKLLAKGALNLYVVKKRMTTSIKAKRNKSNRQKNMNKHMATARIPLHSQGACQSNGVLKILKC